MPKGGKGEGGKNNCLNDHYVYDRSVSYPRLGSGGYFRGRWEGNFEREGIIFTKNFCVFGNFSVREGSFV